jgi:hypothetical protein
MPAIPGDSDGGHFFVLSVRYRRDQFRDRSVVAKGAAQMRIQITIPRSKDKTPAQLERIFANAGLFESRRFGALAADGVIAAKQMKDVGLAQACRVMRLAALVHQKRKRDAELFAELSREVHSAQANGGDVSALRCNLLLVVTQLRDVLAAEDSTPMTQKNHHRGLGLP